MRNIVIFIAVALFLTSLATAFNCNELQGVNREICNSIQNSDLTQQEKDLLIADIFNENQVYPEHDFIYYWNTNLNLKNSPDQTYASLGTIRNAWLKILSLSPSVIEDKVLYGSNNGKLISEYNFDVKLPSGTQSGDCKTKYYLQNKDADLKVYLNNKLIGTNKISSFYTNSNSDNLNFKSELDIKVRYKIKHYERERYCCRYEEGKCVRRCSKCSYDRTEYKTDRLTLTDNFNAKLYKIKSEASFNVIDKYRDITKGILQANNYTNLILEFINSKYENSKYIYTFNYSTPYYILTLKADKLENTKFNNLNLQKSADNLLISVKDDSNCKLKVYDHFSSKTINCNSNYIKTEFEIKTDKLNYLEDETIKVEISPKNIQVKVTYANQTKEIQSYVEFKAVLYQNKITAELNGKTESRIINVKSKTNQLFVQNFVVLGFFSYFVYSFLKKYHQKAKLL